MQIEEIYKIYKKHPLIFIDNRKVEPGSIFVAIRGEKFDGNSFAASALAAGAAFAIIDNNDFFIDERTILVNDTLKTLQQLANFHRRTFNIPFIAICGSNGKTTTKELTHAVLATTYKTFATKGNLNNHIGVPLTLLSIPADTEMAIIEIGANHLQETFDLCKIAEPGFGVVTNNGKDHLEGFGNIQNVIKANSELFEWLKQVEGTAFVNTNYADLVDASAGLKKVNYGFGLVNDYEFTLLPGNYASIRLNRQEVNIQSKLFGAFNGDNMATAAAIALYFNVPVDRIKLAIEQYEPGMNRSQILQKNEITFFVDCYNANPSSMKAALDSFSKAAQQPCGVILADMLELGEYSLTEHNIVVEQLKNLSFTQIVLVGTFFGQLKDTIPCIHFNTTAEAADWFKKQDFAGWSWLLKGSRGYALEKLINF
jgi:UDP-N-acetylmuramoyl-tripeptide--D-alanyl-D-alanine ligase